MKKLFLLLLTIASIALGVSAQTRSVQGTVVYAGDNEPLAGATILPVGGGNGVSTDLDGKFTLKVPADCKHLVVSYVGMITRQVDITDGDMLVKLTNSENNLDEVMVVAYGTAKKSSFTGSASTVSAKTIEKLSVSNVSKALEGAAPGVQVAMSTGQPGSSASIRIRGIGSINSSSAPLYVVDGMPYDGSIAAINPSDIESMTVLKDAASTALYGSRAANGVIVITTKKGSAQKSRVTFDARVGINSRAVSEYDIMTDPGEYMKTYWTVLKNKLGSGAEASANLYTSLGYNPYACDNGAIVDENGNLTTARLLYHDNWEDETISNGLRQEYNLGISGGSEKSNHYLSLGYLDDEGLIANSDYTRLSVRASGDFTINKHIKVNGNVAYSRGEQNSNGSEGESDYANPFSFIRNIAPIYPVYAYDKEGNRLYDENGGALYDFGDGTYGSRPYGSMQNVVATNDANKNQSIVDNLSSRFGATVSFLKDFTANVNMGYDLYNNTINQFITPDFGDAKEFGGRGYKYRTRSQTYTVNELLTYNKTLFEKHHIDVLAGHENHKMIYDQLTTHKTKFFDSENPEFNNAIKMEDMYSSTLDYTVESYFGRLNYDFDDKYYFSGSLRTDGSSRFHKDNRWGTFWSLGGSWRISKENFMKDLTWIDNLSIRTSYGSVGNDNLLFPNGSSNYYPYKSQYEVANSDGAFAVSKTYHGNPDLTWETSYNFNIGLSASLLNNMLDIDVEYFNKTTEDMLYNVPQPTSSGISYIAENALTMTNRGIEFTLGINIPLPKEFRWRWTFTGTHYTNEVTDIPENKQEKGITHAAYYNIKEGGSVYDFYYYRYAGLNETGHSLWYYDELDENGNVIDVKTTDDYTKATKYNLGSALPDFQGGITTEFAWKGIDFSVAANYQIGGKVYDSTYAGLMHAGSSAGTNWHRDILNAWSESNQSSNIPVLDGNQNANTFSDRFLIGADFFNIRNITLGYTFPKQWLKAAMIENARIYFAADNVALWSKRKGLDPRQSVAGLTSETHSAIRTVSMGLSLTF